MEIKKASFQLAESLYRAGIQFRFNNRQKLEKYIIAVVGDADNQFVQLLIDRVSSNELTSPILKIDQEMVKVILNNTKAILKCIKEREQVYLLILLFELKKYCINGSQMLFELIKGISRLILCFDGEIENFHAIVNNSIAELAIDDENFLLISNKDFTLAQKVRTGSLVKSDSISGTLLCHRISSISGLFVFQFLPENSLSKIPSGFDPYQFYVINTDELKRILFFYGFEIDSYEEIKKFSETRQMIFFRGTDVCPTIEMSVAENFLFISGVSMPLSAFDFYQPIIYWLGRQRLERKLKILDLHFHLDFFDTQSARFILEVIRKSLELRGNGTEISIFWHYQKSDEDILEAGRDYSLIVEYDFHFVEMDEKPVTA